MLFGPLAFLGSFLLFQIELIAGQAVLPRYGGSYYVWTACLLFYQVLLVAGYAYALVLAERFPPRRLIAVHLALLAAALAFMPSAFPPPAFESPVFDLLWRLGRLIALPFLLLSASTTLCQRLMRGSPFSVFAWSNAGSLAGMLSYALLLEPALPSSALSRIWRGLFVLYGLGFAAGLAGRQATKAAVPATEAGEPRPYFLWAVLPAGTAALLAAVTSYQSSATASMPLTWMIPLCVYLLSYAVLFSGRELSVNALRLGLFGLLALLCGLLWRFQSPLTTILIALLNWALLFACLIAHRELYLARPRSPALAPRYYLLMGLGGVAGTALVTPVGALRLSFGFADLYVALILFVASMAYAVGRERGLGLRAMALSAALLAGLFAFGMRLSKESQVYGLRNFYGVYRVEDDRARGLRRFVHGTTVHGIQRLAAGQEGVTTVYYSAESPIREVLNTFPARRVGAVGLGVGISCADARKGTEWVFYELDPDVLDIARRYFSFLSRCKADLQVVTGDARLSLQREPPGRFDLLYLDAFSGGSVPFHLLTKEALELYRSRLRPGGAMVFHLSANFLDLVSVLRLGAGSVGLKTMVKKVSFDPDDPDRLSSEWLVASEDETYLAELSKRGWREPEAPQGWPVWTDERRNVLKAIKW
ncbi:MAG TPA: hypothetical protein DCM05_00115 [Elusimicrobia bacterium]|nr:hypothetical protein [Elusimicrobiota bacterium]